MVPVVQSCDVNRQARVAYQQAVAPTAPLPLSHALVTGIIPPPVKFNNHIDTLYQVRLCL